MMGYGGIPPTPASFPIPGHSSGRPRSFRGADGSVRLVLLMRMDQSFGAKNELVDESHAISVSARLFHARIDGDSLKSSKPGRQP